MFTTKWISPRADLFIAIAAIPLWYVTLMLIPTRMRNSQLLDFLPAITTIAIAAGSVLGAIRFSAFWGRVVAALLVLPILWCLLLTAELVAGGLGEP